jgi:general nucleoside transport system ATP-binding protein
MFSPGSSNGAEQHDHREGSVRLIDPARGGSHGTAPVLSMRGITKRFPGVLANDHVDLDLYPGEVLGLLGENGAGKTTLMNILYGLTEPDEGVIDMRGTPARLRSPSDAVALGIGMVHQHFMLVPDMTVAENVALGKHGPRYPLLDLRTTAEEVARLADEHGLRVDPTSVVEDLTVGARQRVEILKLLHRGADILVLDEPTSVLTPQEWEHLAAVLSSLVAEGRSVIFITHKLDELLGIADRCMVLRDGRVVDTVEVARTTKADLARMMVGREVVIRLDVPPVRLGHPVLEVDELSLDGPSGQLLDDLSFTVREGEILGVAGVDGNGQQELVDVLSGVRLPSSGTVRVAGRQLDRPRRRGSADEEPGTGVITDDRHDTGVALPLSVRDNLLLKRFRSPAFSRHGVLRVDRMRRHATELIELYDIRTPSQNVSLRQLSGGNQQKVVLARELHTNPVVLIASQPTRGLDIGAMEFVYAELLTHRQRGAGILLISTELDEILAVSDRIAVMYKGRFLAIVDPADASPETIGLLMAGQSAA